MIRHTMALNRLNCNDFQGCTHFTSYFMPYVYRFVTGENTQSFGSHVLCLTHAGRHVRRKMLK